MKLGSPSSRPVTLPFALDRYAEMLLARARTWPRSAYFYPAALWAVSRAIILFWAVLVVSVQPVRNLHLLVNNAAIPVDSSNPLFAPWARWDTLWYLRIATDGYSSGDLTGGFFPLYPLLIRALTVVLRDPLVSAILISNLAFLVALFVFFRLSCRLAGEAVGRRAALYWTVFPMSFYFFAGYSESLFIAAALLSIMASTEQRWNRAGVAGALATLTRPPGFLVGIPLGIEWLLSPEDSRARIRRALPLALIPAAVGLFMLYLQLTFGDPFFWLHAWHNVTVMPWDLVSMTIGAIRQGTALGNNLVDLSFTLFILGLALLGARRLPLSLTAFSLALILVQMMAYPPALGFADMPMAGLARRVAVVFPAFIVLAQVWRGRFREPLWVGLSVTLQLLFVTIFVRWLWLD